MENFFNWMSKMVPKDEVEIWFNVHNMNYEKIELFGDIFKSLNYIVMDTYLGNDDVDTRIEINETDKEVHFEWCWEKLIKNFNSENVKIKETGQHKDYFKSFFLDTFYNPKERSLKNAIPNFLEDVFDLEKDFSKPDLDILTELYLLLDKNIQS